MPLAVARESSIRLIDRALAGDKLVGVFTQRDAALDAPAQADLFPVGTLTHIHKMFKLADGSLRLIVQGLTRVRLAAVVSSDPFITADVSPAEEAAREEDRLEIDALQRNIKNNFQQVVSLSPLLSDDLQSLAANVAEPGKLADFIASSLTTLPTSAKQQVLETLDIRTRMDDLNRLLIKELEVLELGSKIQSQVQSEVGKNQREYLLREQLKAIQKELGEGDDQTKEIAELREKIDAGPACPRRSGRRRCESSTACRRCRRRPRSTTVSRTYLDWMVALPWDARTPEVIDLERTKGGPRRRSLRSGQGQGPHSRVPRGAQAQSRGQGAHPLLRGAARRRQDVAGEVDRGVAGPQVRPRLAGRHARRGRDPRAPPHLHRRAARPGHPGPAQGGVPEPGVHPRRDRQARHGLPRRPGLGPARGARSGAEQHVPGPLPRRAVRPVGGALHHDGQRARSDSAGPARPHGGARAAWVHGRREARDCRRAPGRAAGAEPRSDRRAALVHAAGAAGHHPRVHAGGGRPEPRARDRRHLPQGGPPPGRGRCHAGRGHPRDRHGHAGRPEAPRRGGSRSARRTPAWPWGSRGRRSGATCSSWRRAEWRAAAR